VGILSWVLFGLVAGAVAKLILPGKDPGGVIVTILIGVIGGFLGGWLSSLFGGRGITGFNVASFAWAVVGALVLLLLYRLFLRHRGTPVHR
jgi:uncharacterized membrane protein YeaQ/YmgE (transglycosylase-associated protein family)